MSNHRGHRLHYSRAGQNQGAVLGGKARRLRTIGRPACEVRRLDKEFAKRGGNLVIKDAGPQDVDGYAKSHDLVLVAAGKGEINRMFERDAEKSPFDQPMRALALTYVKNMVPREPFTAVSFNLVPGVGEYFVFPALTTTGVCEIMVFEGVPGGPMDCWNE